MDDNWLRGAWYRSSKSKFGITLTTRSHTDSMAHAPPMRCKNIYPRLAEKFASGVKQFWEGALPELGSPSGPQKGYDMVKKKAGGAHCKESWVPEVIGRDGGEVLEDEPQREGGGGPPVVWVLVTRMHGLDLKARGARGVGIIHVCQPHKSQVRALLRKFMMFRQEGQCPNKKPTRPQRVRKKSSTYMPGRPSKWGRGLYYANRSYVRRGGEADSSRPSAGQKKKAAAYYFSNWVGLYQLDLLA